MDHSKKDFFTFKMFFRQFVPAVISAITLAIGDMADAIVLGNRIGVTGLATISLSLPVFMVINVIMHGLGAGGSICFSKQLARGNREQAVRGFQGIMTAAFVLGILLAVSGNVFLEPMVGMLGAAREDGEIFWTSCTYVQMIISACPLFFCTYIMNYYLRNDDKEKVASFGAAAGNITDIVLNVVFVLVFRMGVMGAALATILGLAASLCIYLFGMLYKKGNLEFLPFHPEIKDCWNCFRTGFSTSCQYLFSMIFLLIANHLLMNMDGSRGVAIFEMVQNVSFLIMYIYDGTAKALQPLLSTYYGERNQSGWESALKMGIFWGSIAGAIAFLFIFLFPQAVCRIFGIREAADLELGIHALRVYVLGTYFVGINVILEGYFQSVNKEKGAFLIACLRGTVNLIPLMFLFSRMGIMWFWWTFPVTEILSLAAILLWYRGANKGDEVDSERVYTRTISNRDENLILLLEEIEEFCAKWESTPKQQYFMNMAVEELCVAIMQHAFEKEEGYIQLTLIAEDDGSFELHVRDSAVSFNPFEMDCTPDEDDIKMDVVGIMVIKTKAKEFFYRRYQGFNTLVVKI